MHPSGGALVWWAPRCRASSRVGASQQSRDRWAGAGQWVDLPKSMETEDGCTRSHLGQQGSKWAADSWALLVLFAGGFLPRVRSPHCFLLLAFFRELSETKDAAPLPNVTPIQ